MNNKPIETQPEPAVNDTLDLVLNNDELDQLAKFLDALLEADLSNKSNKGDHND